ncbi:MAG: peptidylprolyl isomerase, partial [Ilumatobacter sp.]
MGTEKRERKKANRAARQQREVRRDRLIGLRRRAVRWGVIVVGAVAAVVAIAAIGGAFSDDSEQANQRVDDPTTEVVEDVSTVTAGEESTAEACPPTDGSAAQRREFDAYPPMCIDEAGSYSAVIETNFGSMTVELDADAAPLTVNNFVTLARYGYFNDTVCHRIIPD